MRGRETCTYRSPCRRLRILRDRHLRKSSSIPDLRPSTLDKPNKRSMNLLLIGKRDRTGTGGRCSPTLSALRIRRWKVHLSSVEIFFPPGKCARPYGWPSGAPSLATSTRSHQSEDSERNSWTFARSRLARCVGNSSETRSVFLKNWLPIVEKCAKSSRFSIPLTQNPRSVRVSLRSSRFQGATLAPGCREI